MTLERITVIRRYWKFRSRNRVHTEIKKYVTIKSEIWKNIGHYYDLRCKFIHQRATVGVNNSELGDFREIVEGVLKKLYKLKFEAA